MKKQIGYIGLGKMGMSMALRLKHTGWNVMAFDIFEPARKTAKKEGIAVAESIQDMMEKLACPRVIWLMVPAFAPDDQKKSPVDGVIEKMSSLLVKGDTVIDGGNSFYEHSVRRGKELARLGIDFVDVGVSGGPGSVKAGKPALMIGGDKRVWRKLAPLFASITEKQSVGYMGTSGSGHFVKMVHNGIEYGMMQAIAEGFSVMKNSPFDLKLEKVARIYNCGSVIESRLIGWLEDGFRMFGDDLESVSGSVRQTGEGAWTARIAKKFGVRVPVIENAVKFRSASMDNPNYTGKILTALRNRFGGHSIAEN